MSDGHQPSLMLAIVSKDSILFSEGFGLSDVTTKHRANGNTLFPMASITKTFTALAIMKLVNQGRISLNDNLAQIAPEVAFKNPWEKTNPVKIIHLLEHTSGFDDLRFNTFWNSDITISEFRALEKTKKSMYCRWKPGERNAYSNIGYNILGYLIEKISGVKYETFMAKEILLPLGMTHSNFIIPVQTDSLHAQPYEWNNNSYKRLPFLQMIGKGSGALYSCANDMAKFIQFLLKNGIDDSVPGLQGVVGQMETPVSTPAAAGGLLTGYAKGITIGFLNEKYPFFGHDGAAIGFHSRYAYNRTLELGFVICSNSPESISDLLVKQLTQSFPAQVEIPIPTVNTETLKTYEGYYQLRSPRFELLNKYLEELFHGYHIKLKDDGLHAYGFKRNNRILLPVSPNIFRNPKENSPSFLFTTNDKGRRVMYEWGAYYERTSFTKILLLRIVVLGSLVCGISLLLSAIFWIFRALLKKITWNEFFKRSLSSFGMLCLLTAFGSLAYLSTNVPIIGEVNIYTVTFFCGTIFFALLTVAGSIVTLQRFTQIKGKWTKWYLSITTTWLLCLVFFMFWYGWIGLRMWSY